MRGDTFITVPGTGDTEVLADREKWWQTGSPFQTALFDQLGLAEHPGFTPFSWSGTNSERARRKAARLLIRELRQLDRDGVAFHLIGHSHGGSVIAEAMLIAARRRIRLDSLKSITTIGTPFIEFAFQRIAALRILRSIRDSWPLLSSFLLAFVCSIIISQRGMNMGGLLDPIGPIGQTLVLVVCAIADVLVGPLLLIGLVRALFFTKGHRFRRKDLKRASRLGRIWLGIWDKNDEAIASLAVARHVQMSLFRGWRISGVIQLLMNLSFYLALVSVFIVGVVLIVSVSTGAILGGAGAYFKPAQAALGWFAQEVSPRILFSIGLMGGGAIWAVIVGSALGALFLLFRFIIDPVFRLSGAKWLDQAAASQLRRQAYGLDISGEWVRGASAKPWFSRTGWAPLPQSIHDELLGVVNSAAVTTVSKLRDFLGSAYISGRRVDVLADLTGQLSWNELIHTSYFDIPRLTKLIALGITRAADEPVPATLASDHEIAQWLDAMSTGDGS